MTLKGLNFQNRDLRFIIAKNTGFQKCNFNGAHLGGANLEFAKLWRAKLYGTILVDTNLRSSFTRLVSVQNSFIRESDLRIFHHDIMGPQRTFNSILVTVSSIVASSAMVFPLAAEFVGPTIAPFVAGSIMAALIHRPVIDLARGGWYFRPIKNLHEVLSNEYQKTLDLIEVDLSQQIAKNPWLQNEYHSVRTPQNIELNKQIDVERGIVEEVESFDTLTPREIKTVTKDAKKNPFINEYLDEINETERYINSNEGENPIQYS